MFLLVVLGMLACADGLVQDSVLSADPLYVVAIDGEDAPLIVLHGGPALRHNYLRPEFDAFALGHRVIYYDQRGCGRSTESGPFTWEQHVADLRNVITGTLGVDRVTLIGSSWGALLALLFAGHHPELVTAVVATGLPFWPDSAAARRVHAMRDSLRRELPKQIRALDADTIGPPANSGAGRRRMDSAAVAAEQASALGPVLASRLGTACLDVRAAVSASFATVPGVEWLRSLRMPVLMVYGADGPDGRIAGQLRDVLPDVEVAALSEAGHDPWFDSPERFVAVVERFLGRVGLPSSQ